MIMAHLWVLRRGPRIMATIDRVKRTFFCSFGIIVVVP